MVLPLFVEIGAGSPMPEYNRLGDVVAQEVITCGVEKDDVGIHLDDGSGMHLAPNHPMLARYVPKVGDFLITHSDEHQSFSPRDAFEQAYSPKDTKGIYASRLPVLLAEVISIDKNMGPMARVPCEGRVEIHFANGFGLNTLMDEPVFARYFPEVGDFLITYPDGYQSFKPRQDVLDRYSKIEA